MIGKCLTRSRTWTSGSSRALALWPRPQAAAGGRRRPGRRSSGRPSARLLGRPARRRAPPRASARPAARPTGAGAPRARAGRRREWLGSPGTGSSCGSMRAWSGCGVGAARMEVAARGRADQAGRRAGDRHERLRAVAVEARDRLQQAPRVGVLGAARRALRAEAVSTIRPGVHDRDVVGHLGDHAEIVGDDHDRHPELAAGAVPSAPGSAPGRSRRAPSWARRRSAAWARWPAPSRSSRAGACRRRTRADTRRRAAWGRGSRPARAARPRAPCAFALETSLCARTASISCLPTSVERVQRRQRVLEDHRDVVAADRAQLVFGQRHQVAAFEQDPPRDAARPGGASDRASSARRPSCPSPTRRRCRASCRRAPGR